MGHRAPLLLAALLAFCACGKDAPRALSCGPGTVERGGQCVAEASGTAAPAASVPSTPPAPPVAPAPARPTKESLIDQFADDLAKQGMCGRGFEPGRCGNHKFKKTGPETFSYVPVYSYDLAGCPAGKPCESSKETVKVRGASVEVGDTEEYPFIGTVQWSLDAPSGIYGPGPTHATGTAPYAFAARSKKWRWQQ